MSSEILSQIDHLAGIVPIAGLPLDYKQAIHDSMILVDKDLLAVERSVMECAYAGCDTIWVVCHMKTEPILKKRMGNFICDPVKQDDTNVLRIKHIPIYYVPIHPRDRDRRDCLSWSVLYGAKISYYISGRFSTWLMPKKFYCSFPYGIFDMEYVKNNRYVIKSTKKVIFSYDNLTVKDNLHLSFTFNEEDFLNCKKTLHQRDLEEWQRTARGATTYDLKTSFSKLIFHNVQYINLPWFYDISSWDKYKKYISSDHSNLNLDRQQYFIDYKKVNFKID